MSIPRVIIYDTDPDGFTSALLWRLATEREGKQFLTIPHSTHGYNPPDVENLRGKDVVLVDLSITEEWCDQVEQVANSFLVCDHHASASWLASKPYAHYNTKLAACEIVWGLLRPDLWDGKQVCSQQTLVGLEQLVRYVADRDMWRWQLDDSRYINNYIRLVDHTFEDYMQLCKLMYEYSGSPTGSVIRTAGQILEKYALSQQQTYEGRERLIALAGHKDIPVVNITQHHSDVIGGLAKDKPFAAGYFIVGNSVTWSLRSTDAGVDVGEICKRFGGGGHRNAAGFTVNNLHHLAKKELNTLEDFQ